MDETRRKLKVMVVDDHDVVRLGLKTYIDAEPDLDVVAEASSGNDAVELAKVHNPDIVIMDVRMPDGDGVEACREIRSLNPVTSVIMMTAYADDDALFKSIMAGAAGYLLKGIHRQDLVDSIRSVGEGRALLDPAVTEKVLDRIRHPKADEKDPKLSHLSPTEERVLDLVAEGLTNRQIAGRINLSDKTVKNYVSSVLQKLHVARRSEAASYVTRIRTENRQKNDA